MSSNSKSFKTANNISKTNSKSFKTAKSRSTNSRSKTTSNSKSKSNSKHNSTQDLVSNMKEKLANYIKNIPKDNKYFYGGFNINLALSIFKYSYSKYECECIQKTKINYYKIPIYFQNTLFNYIITENAMCLKNNRGMEIDYLADSLKENRIIFAMFNCDQNILHSIASINIYSSPFYLKINALCVNQIEKQVGGSVLLSVIINFAIELKIDEIKLESVPTAIEFYKKNGFQFVTEEDKWKASNGIGCNMFLKINKPKTSSSFSGGNNKMYIDVPHTYYNDPLTKIKDIKLTKNNYSNYADIAH